MSFALRPYQRAALDALYTYWQRGGGNGLIVLPTGSGKSLVLAALCQELIRDYPLIRIGIVTHVRELIKQDSDELLALWPEAPAGIYSAGMKRRDVDSQILFCGIQSVWRRTELIGKFDLILIDEAHLVGHSDETTYRKFIAKLRELEPDLRVVGLTATAFRLDVGRLDRGKRKLFDDIVYDANVGQLIEQGFLCNLSSKGMKTKLDVTGVGTRAGEFIASELEIKIDQDWIVRGAVDEIVAAGAKRKSWLVFCVGVKHATHVAEEIRSRGVSCETITGDTPKQQRDRMVAQFKSGEIKCLTSVMVIAIGFNAPNADLIALLRPTKSAGLFLQQVGRGLRKADGKENCLILDFAGNTQRHGFIDTINVDSVAAAGETAAAAPMKKCPQCDELVPTAKKICTYCGHIFEVEEVIKHAAVAAEIDILSRGKVAAPEWVTVNRLVPSLYCKPSGTPSLCLEYHCGLMSYREWLALEHQGGARWWAEKKWLELGGLRPVPHRAAEGLVRAGELKMPTEIQVRRREKFFEVVGRRYGAGVKAKAG